MGPCGEYEGGFDRSMCTGGRWYHTEERPKSHFWEWVSAEMSEAWSQHRLAEKQ